MGVIAYDDLFGTLLRKGGKYAAILRLIERMIERRANPSDSCPLGA